MLPARTMANTRAGVNRPEPTHQPPCRRQICAPRRWAGIAGIRVLSHPAETADRLEDVGWIAMWSVGALLLAGVLGSHCWSIRSSASEALQAVGKPANGAYPLIHIRGAQLFIFRASSGYCFGKAPLVLQASDLEPRKNCASGLGAEQTVTLRRRATPIGISTTKGSQHHACHAPPSERPGVSANQSRIAGGLTGQPDLPL